VAVIVVEREVMRPIEAVWAVVSDVATHRLPLTTVRTDPGAPGVGWRFRAVSSLGPVRCTDVMVVTQWSPPGAFGATGDTGDTIDTGDTAGYAVVKTGWVLSGWARVSLRRLAPECTRLRWEEEIVAHPHALGRLAKPVSDRAVRAMFERAVSEMVRRA
jgi:hypothetical protein